jgi:hypothetical protein
MDENEIISLRKKYSELSDESLTDMIRCGRDDYQPGVYDLLLTEAVKRGIESKIDSRREISEEKQPQPSPCQGLGEEEDALVEFAELMQIKSDSDVAFLESVLGQTDIAYYVSGRDDFKMEIKTLMVDSSRLEDVKELLKDFTPSP